jgi:molybdopterin-guanine dinucleotide biosynthesis protein A
LGEHTPRAMLDKIETRYVKFSEFANLTGSEHFFFNLNHPEDYELAKEIALHRRPAR